MKQTVESIRKSIISLRKLIDSSSDPIVYRIAHAVETALTWAIENTTNWPLPEQEVLKQSEIFRQELRDSEVKP